MRPMPPRNLVGMLAAAAIAVALVACGDRSSLDIPLPSARADAAVVSHVPDAARDVQRDVVTPKDAAACAPFPAAPTTPLGPAPSEACSFDPEFPGIPVVAAIVGPLLVAVTWQGEVRTLFTFATAGETSYVVSRGHFLGAMVVTQPASGTVDAELVLLRLDREGNGTKATVVVHRHESLSAESFGGSSGVVGNDAGTFAFTIGIGNSGVVWVAGADGRFLGPIEGYTFSGTSGGLSPFIDPDARGRIVVLPAMTNSTADLYWLDPCAGTTTVVALGGDTSPYGWGGKLFNIRPSGQLVTETADSVTPLAIAPVAANDYPIDFSPSGFAMFRVPPYPTTSGDTGSFLLANLNTLTEHTATIAFPAGLFPVPTDSSITQIGDSNDPAGFGLDSQGDLTLFLSNSAGTNHLETTADGADWTPVGDALLADPDFEPQQSLFYVEAAGTYLIAGEMAGVGTTFHVVRPASGVDVPIPFGLATANISASGYCASAPASATSLAVVSATTGSVNMFTLPAPATTDGWASTWIPGDDAVVYAPWL
jgi:hypothetical protein